MLVRELGWNGSWKTSVPLTPILRTLQGRCPLSACIIAPRHGPEPEFGSDRIAVVIRALPSRPRPCLSSAVIWRDL